MGSWTEMIRKLLVQKDNDVAYISNASNKKPNALRLFKMLSPDESGLALPRILHSSDTSMFLLFWSNMKLDNSVAIFKIHKLPLAGQEGKKTLRGQ